MTTYQQRRAELQRDPKCWLVTGAAGFIGSNLVEELLRLDQFVVGLDDFSSGHQRNLDEVERAVEPAAWDRFEMEAGDIRDLEAVREACDCADYVLHHAAIGSVPLSLEKPLLAHDVNVTGTFNLLLAAQEAGARRFVYASSSAVYGDDATLPKVEEKIGRCLSPYALTKLVNESYAQMAASCYALETVGLRYFNIFGPRQDPNGAYAAVIPKWIAKMMRNEPVEIFGDGETTRDFCHVADVVQANILAATCPEKTSVNRVFNVARRWATSRSSRWRRDWIRRWRGIGRIFEDGNAGTEESDGRRDRSAEHCSARHGEWRVRAERCPALHAEVLPAGDGSDGAVCAAALRTGTAVAEERAAFPSAADPGGVVVRVEVFGWEETGSEWGRRPA